MSIVSESISTAPILDVRIVKPRNLETLPDADGSIFADVTVSIDLAACAWPLDRDELATLVGQSAEYEARHAIEGATGARLTSATAIDDEFRIVRVAGDVVTVEVRVSVDTD